jgi:hypothetical protein
MPRIVPSIQPLSPPRVLQTLLVLLGTLHVFGQPSDKVTVELDLVIVYEVAAALTTGRTWALGSEKRLSRHLWGNRLFVDETVDVLVFCRLK